MLSGADFGNAPLVAHDIIHLKQQSGRMHSLLDISHKANAPRTAGQGVSILPRALLLRLGLFSTDRLDLPIRTPSSHRNRSYAGKEWRQGCR